MAEHRRYDELGELRYKDIEVTGIQKVGLSGLSLIGNNSAMRSVMFNAHTKQMQTLVKPEIANMVTGVENVVAAISSTEVKASTNYIIHKKYVKYGDIINSPTEYTLFLYDPEQDRYEIRVVHHMKNLTEIYGYQHNTEYIDQKEEGDEIYEGDRIISPTSYDEFGNWRYGINANFYPCLVPNSTQDACIISDEFAKRGVSNDVIQIPFIINDNDFPLNIYGKEEGGFYQIFPDIGEKTTEGILVAMRKKINTRMLYDFKEDALREIQSSDTVFPVDERMEVVDVEIFCNNSELQENRFNAQIVEYLKSQTAYYTDIYKTCQWIIDKSGSDYSQNVEYWKKRSLQMIDGEAKWRKDDKVFNNLCLRFTLKRLDTLTVGRKITGRHGNKSVIAEIRPKDQMPFCINEDGTRTYADIMGNIPAFSNRTVGSAILETYHSYIVRNLAIHMRSHDFTMEEKEDMWFSLLYELEPQYGKNQWEYYSALSNKKKKLYFEDIMWNEVRPVQCIPYETSEDPFENPEAFESYLFNRMHRAMKDHEWAKPRPLYEKDPQTGIERRVMKDACIGTMYMLKLKQDDKKQFSCRSNGAVNSKNLPEKSHKNKLYQERYPSTAVRFGESESLNFFCGMPSDEIAYFHALYRTSPEGRENLMRQILTDEPIVSVPYAYENLVAVYNNVIFKSLGLELVSYDDDYTIDTIEDTSEDMTYDEETGMYVMETKAETMYRERRRKAEEYIAKRYPGIDTLEYEELIERYMKDDVHYVMDTNIDPDNMIQLADDPEELSRPDRFVFPNEDKYNSLMDEEEE